MLVQFPSLLHHEETKEHNLTSYQEKAVKMTDYFGCCAVF